MKRKVIFIAAAATTALFAGTPKEIPLDWSPAWKSGTVYEVEIDRARLHKAAGINPNYGFSVFAEKNGSKLPLDVTHFAGKNKDSVALRFNVPAGTDGLVCMTGAKNIRISDALTDGNVFSGAFTDKNLPGWKSSPWGRKVSVWSRCGKGNSIRSSACLPPGRLL